MGFSVPGFKIGHVANATALTGCTVILCPPRTIGGCDVRGSSPASREIELLSSEKTVQEVHAVLFSGGSAFGLAAADGVMRYLEERNIGYQTPWIKVPIVPAACIFDLNIGDKSIRPTASDGYAACEKAREGNDEQGNVGAGTGATVGKWSGPESRMKGGIGTSILAHGELLVGCIAVVNAVGDIVDGSGKVLAGARSPSGEFLGDLQPLRPFASKKVLSNTNTTLVAVLTNAQMTKVQANRLAQRAHDGMARAVIPAHTSYDGDLVITLASGNIETSFDLLAEMTAVATAEAIRGSVRHASSAGSVPGLAG